MLSPFPGMDPFLESLVWEDFHSRFIQGVSDSLVPQVRPRYVVRVERRVYLEHQWDDSRPIRPDVSVVSPDDPPAGFDQGRQSSASVEPVVCTLPLPEEVREPLLTIRERDTGEVVTVIEVLSPGNKRPGSDGRREYLAKREQVLQSSANLVELDLLRGGERLPTIDPLPSGDYMAFVCRARQRPKAEVYAWSLHDPLPSIPAPLAPEDEDITINLQQVFTSAYDRAGYDYSVNYQAALNPPSTRR